MKKHNEIDVMCWNCGNIVHVEYKYPDGAVSEKASESNASNFSFAMRGDDIF